jgi:tetratricopeptide (TPR) repeat protein
MKNERTRNKSIFVSSTFRDMQAERDALRDFVIPHVNEFAARYGRAVELTDLRWGVDTSSVSEEEQNHKVLRTCLDEIRRSRPFFLGLIGDRYGWTPPRPEMDAALESAEFSLEDSEMSVTALEMVYGALRAEEPPICLFYFREGIDYSALPEQMSNVYKDGAEGSAKLETLKAEIRARFGGDTKTYTAKVHGNGLDIPIEWAEMVAADIIEKLRGEWGEPSDAPRGWKEQERDLQDSFRESRTAFFAGRSAAIDDLATFCLGDGPPPQLLMVQGEAGSGKSGLLAKVMDAVQDRCLLLPFFCGLSPRSAIVETMLRYFIAILCSELSLEDDSEALTKFQDLKDRFIELLFSASAKMRVVAVVDALDQLGDSDEARRMLWISGRLPENFRLLCSIIDGPETQAITQLGGAKRTVPAISMEDEAAIIHGIAARHHKQIGGALVDHILQKQTPDGAQAAQNPLYLSLIAQDLVMMDRYELDTVQRYMDSGLSQPEALAKFMKERIDETPGDPEGAYLAILGRMEKLIGRDFVRGACGMIAISRGGLRDMDFDSVFRKLGMAFNPADFSWLRQLLRGHFSQGDVQQWDFSHQSLRRALKKDRPEELRRLSDQITAHFCGIMDRDDFAVREIMHQLCVSDKPGLAAEVIAGCRFTHTHLLIRGLADVFMEHKEGGAFLMGIPASGYKAAGSGCWRIAAAISEILPLLPENSQQFKIYLMLETRSMLVWQEDEETLAAISSVGNTLADLHMETGQTEKAGQYYQESIKSADELYKRFGTPENLRGLAVLYNRMGNYLTATGRTEEAYEFNRLALETAEKLYEQLDTEESMLDLMQPYSLMGDHMKSSGRMDEAGHYYMKAVDAARELCARRDAPDTARNLSVSYSRAGLHLLSLGQVDKAGDFYKKALEIDTALHEQQGTAGTLSDLSVSYENMGDYLEALGHTEGAGEFCRKLLDARKLLYDLRSSADALLGLAVAYQRVGDHLASTGEMEKAGDSLQKSMEAFEIVHSIRGTTDALYGLSVSYERMGNHMLALGLAEESGEYYNKAMQSFKELHDSSGTVEALFGLSMVYGRVAELFSALGQTTEAGEYYRSFIDTAKDLYGQRGTVEDLRNLALSHGGMGNHLAALGRADEAEEYYHGFVEAAESLYKHSRTPDMIRLLAIAYHKMGGNLGALGQTERSEEFMQKAYEMQEEFMQATQG